MYLNLILICLFETQATTFIKCIVIVYERNDENCLTFMRTETLNSILIVTRFTQPVNLFNIEFNIKCMMETVMYGSVTLSNE